ncbi:MAG TPA: polysaccharide biosynthesis tyrosine autokinase [Sphingomicrobium sp.]|nr:polysaccharide biosynthesis tyrosine autokinase [Sphingomicrobium sp.]
MMNTLVPAAPRSFAELEAIPYARPMSQATAVEQVIAAVYRQRFVIAIAVGVCMTIGALVSILSPSKYTASASVQLDQQIPQLLGDKGLDPQVSIQDSDRFLQTQIDLIRSRSIADSVATKLKLAKSPQALKAIGIDDPGPDAETAHAVAVAQLQDNVQVQLGLNTRLAEIYYTTTDANLSARIANGFAESLQESNIDSKLQVSNKAKEYLTQQLAKAKQRLETSETQMLSYARQEDLTTTVVPSGPNDRGGSLRAQELGQLTDSLAQVTSQRIAAQERWQQVQNTPAMNLPEVQSNSAIQDLVAQKAQQEASLREERQRHTDKYPTVAEAAAKIKELDAQINSFAANIKSSFYGQYLAAAQQERQMQEKVGQLRGAAMSERERSVGYNALSREVETNKAFYDGLLERYKEIATASGATAANVTIVDQAWPPLIPDSSNLARNMVFGGSAGLIIALLFGAFRERVHHVVRSTSDLEQALSLPALGVVPRLRGPEEVRNALDDVNSAQAEAYHSVAVAVQEACGGVLPKTLLITSSTASEGKSTSAMGIARSLSAMGKSVLLVDGDLRRHASAKMIASDSQPGFSEVLAGSTSPEKAVQRSIGGDFSIVRPGDSASSPVTLLATDGIRRVFDKLAAKHDIVIIDGPPVMGLADAVLLARSVEAVLVVVEANRTHMSEIDTAVSRLPQNNIIGGVITKFDSKSAGVRYGGTEYYTYRRSE